MENCQNPMEFSRINSFVDLDKAGASVSQSLSGQVKIFQEFTVWISYGQVKKYFRLKRTNKSKPA
jgi:hypothetical protein